MAGFHVSETQLGKKPGSNGGKSAEPSGPDQPPIGFPNAKEGPTEDILGKPTPSIKGVTPPPPSQPTTGTPLKCPPLVYIRYRDHVLFRNADPSLFQPSIRETVGWVVKEDGTALWILWDKSVDPLPHERTQPAESGLVILKTEILEIKRIE